MFITVEEEYAKNKDINPEDVKTIIQWVDKQPHLKKLSEAQALLFLHSCYNSVEAAKNTIENFFTIKANCPEVFWYDKWGDLERFLDVLLFTPLPKKTPEGYYVILAKLVTDNVDLYDYVKIHQIVMMLLSLHLAQQGTCEGIVFVIDSQGHTFQHLLKINIQVMKKLLYFIQEALPIRLKQIHVLNSNAIVEKALIMIKPFLKKELIEMINIHTSMETYFKFIPQEIMPSEYKGSAGNFLQLKEAVIKKISQNFDYFEDDKLLRADESKRIGKSKCLEEINCLGMDGTFRKLAID